MLKTLFNRLTGGAVEIPDALWDSTLAQMPIVQRLDADARAHLRRVAGEFLATKEMAAAGGLQLSADMQVNIAVQAALPVLNLGLGWYRGWSSIIVYPDEFLVPRSVTDDAGVVHEYTEPITGEAWDRGPLLLSWADVKRSASDNGAAYAVVIHEFAHKIDLLDGSADGIPPFSPQLHPGLTLARWRTVLDASYHRFVAELELIESELPADAHPDEEDTEHYYAHLPLDAYAGQDTAEFFAVSSEAFFAAPNRLQRAFPDWYQLLADFYRQDPQR